MEKYEGGMVYEPKTGFYYPPPGSKNDGPPDDRDAQRCVAVLDFASLYPLTMISRHLCYSTIVEACDVKRLRAKGMTIDSYRWLDAKLHRHLEVHIAQNIPAVLPTFLSQLYNERKLIKKEMEAEQDPIKEGLLDKRQLAVKVSLNR